MISDCLRNDRTFGVLLIREGGETGSATTYEIGTLAKIVDWYQGNDGLLGITAVGEQRFRLLSNQRQADGLNLGEVDLIAAEPALPIPDRYKAMAHILPRILDDLGRLYEPLKRRCDDASWVSYRFAEFLPISVEQKQHSLESNDPIQRLQLVQGVLGSVRYSTD